MISSAINDYTRRSGLNIMVLLRTVLKSLAGAYAHSSVVVNQQEVIKPCRPMINRKATGFLWIGLLSGYTLIVTFKGFPFALAVGAVIDMIAMIVITCGIDRFGTIETQTLAECVYRNANCASSGASLRMDLVICPQFRNPPSRASWMAKARTPEALRSRSCVMRLRSLWVSSTAHRSLMPWSRKSNK